MHLLRIRLLTKSIHSGYDMSDSGMETVNEIGTQTTERHSMGDVTGAWQP